MTTTRTNRKYLALLLLPFLCVFLFLGSRSSTGTTSAEAQATLQEQGRYALALPAGGQILLQREGRILFMGANIPPNSSRRVILFDTRTAQTLWENTLPGSAIKAEALPGGDYIVVTVQQKGESHLLRLDGQSGAAVWDTAYANPALDVLWDSGREALLVSDGVSLWTVSAGDGALLERLAESVGENPHPESALLVRSTDSPQQLYLASDTLLTALRLPEDGQPETEWRFNSAKFIVQALPVRFATGETGIILLAHSHAYFVDRNGKMVWHIANQDINYGAVALPQAQAAQWVAFGNFVNGLYLVDARGRQAHQALPGGNVRVLGIPLPIPQNVLLGGLFAVPSPAPDFPGFLVVVRSLGKVFAYQVSPAGELSFLAEAAIAKNAGGTLIQQANENPNYPPFAMGDGLAVTGPQGIVVFTLMPK